MKVVLKLQIKMNIQAVILHNSNWRCVY